MSRWEPNDYHRDPMVNAVLNVAASLSALATATDGLLYGLKFGKAEGMSIAEAIEVAAKAHAESLGIAISQAGSDIAEAVTLLEEPRE